MSALSVGKRREESKDQKSISFALLGGSKNWPDLRERFSLIPQEAARNRFPLLSEDKKRNQHFSVKS